jgi:ribose transport system permease protein
MIDTATPPPDATEPAQPPTPSLARRVVLEMDRRNSWVFVALLVLIATFSVLAPDAFPTIANFRNIALDVSILLVIAVGATLVIVARGIDLSVGSVVIFSAVIGAKVMLALGGQGPGVAIVGVLACVAAGAAWGLVNAVLVTRLSIPPLIATLGTLGMALGLAQVLTEGVDIRDVPQSVMTFGSSELVGQIPSLCIIAAFVAVVGGLLLAATRFGRHTYAIGSNPEAARRAGIAVNRHLAKVYVAAGALSGLAGFMSLARFATTTIAGHGTDNLQVITGVVLGGASLFGGAGTVAGTVVGMLIPGVLRNGLVIAGLQSFWQEAATGAALVLAVYVDQLRRRARSRA